MTCLYNIKIVGWITS